MSKEVKTILEVTQGLGFGLLYHSRIGAPVKKSEFPFIRRFRSPRPSQKKIKKTLV